MTGEDLLQSVAALAAAGSAAGLCEVLARFCSSLGPAAAPLRRERGGGIVRLAPLVLLAAANARWLPRGALSLLERWILRAGNPLDVRAAEIAALAEVAAGAFLAAGIGLALVGAIDPAAALVPPVLAAAAPLLWLNDRIRLRRRELVRALPYAVDLLTLSVEAGLDFTAALAKVAERSRPGALRDELSIALKELRLGRTREEALRNLARRTALPAIGSFVQALLHADQMGTPLGKVLRVLATRMRVERTQRAEKLAHEAPVKLLVPLVLCIFPTLFLMLFGPIGYQVFAGGF